MATENTAFLWGRGGAIPQDMNSTIQCSRYRTLRELGQIFPHWLKENKPDLLILVGFFFYDNLIVAKIAKRFRIPVILNPVAQITEQVFKGKIFTQDPDVRKLEQTGLQLPQFKEKLIIQVNPLLKQVYLSSIGRMIADKSDIMAVFSRYEAEQAAKYFPHFKNNYVTLRWGIDKVSEEADQRHYYRDVLQYDDDRANFVYWGRLDWHYKGIDRLLNGVLCCAQQAGGARLPFRIFLIGPDYHGGAEKVKRFIQDHDLLDSVHLMLPGSYPAGSKTPLRDASASVYLSRWDGFPRTLRESTVFEVPVLVSQETHFGELAREYESGIALQNADNSEEIAQALLALADADQRQMYKLGAARLAPKLTWQQATQSFMRECEQILAKTPDKRMALP